MSGSKLDFGDCYTGIANSKVLLIRNTTEATLHVDLTSDRPKEISFELKLQQNRARASRAPRGEEVLSPTGSNDDSSRKGSLSPDGAKAVMSFSNADSINNYGLDSDEEGEENEVSVFLCPFVEIDGSNITCLHGCRWTSTKTSLCLQNDFLLTRIPWESWTTSMTTLSLIESLELL